jgi:hypothetical protein
MDALLEFRGRDFVVDSALAGSPWRTHAKVWHCGDSTGLRRKRVCEDSGLSVRISNADCAKLEHQIGEALITLQRDIEEIRRIRALPGIESASVRFGELWPEEIVARFPRLPSELLLLCGRLGLDIVLCEYLSSGDSDHESQIAQPISPSKAG